VRQAKQGHSADYPAGISTRGQKALYDNLGTDEGLATAVDKAVRETAPFGWRDNRIKERLVKRCIADVLPAEVDTDAIFEVVKAQDDY